MTEAACCLKKTGTFSGKNNPHTIIKNVENQIENFCKLKLLGLKVLDYVQIPHLTTKNLYRLYVFVDC